MKRECSESKFLWPVSNHIYLYKWPLILPGLAEKFILDEDGDGKHDDSLDGHGTNVLSHHFPAEWVLETVFP